MKNTKLFTAASFLLVGGLILTGCAGGNSGEKVDPPKTDKGTDAPAEVNETPAETPAEGSGTASADITAPGAKVGINEWATIEFVGGDDATALIASRLVSVEPATQAQTDFLVEKVPQLKGYNVSFVKVEQQKVSGDTIAYNANYTSFKPITAAGVETQGVSVIGWEDCKKQSFTKEFDTVGTVLTQCLISADVEGGDPTAGVMYAEYDTAYASYEGDPIQFLK